MRRAERLFQIVQILRRARKPVTADALALEMETSKRSIYRDISALLMQDVPIRGEAGVGYVLEKGFDMPPLMLTTDEIDVAVLGAQWVAGRGDPMLAKAAQDLIAKIMNVVPERLRPYVEEPASGTPPGWNQKKDKIDLSVVRSAIYACRKMRLHYVDQDGAASERIIWPITIGYMDTTRMIVAWCESRQDFRHFRTDRAEQIAVLPARYPGTRSALRARWRDTLVYQASERRSRELTPTST